MANTKITDLAALTAQAGDEIPINRAGADGKITAGDIAALASAGGAAIIPETGSSPIKISAFPNATANMSSSDRLDGLQGGANVKFSQAQILTGVEGTYANPYGGNFVARGGDAYGAYNGGYVYLYGGAGYQGGGIQMYSGNGTHGGGELFLRSGDAGSGNGGTTTLQGGRSTGHNGGHVDLTGGRGFLLGGHVSILAGEGRTFAGGVSMNSGTATGGSGGNGGNISINLGNGDGAGIQGFLYFGNLPTSSAGLGTGGIWNNLGVLNIV